MVRAELDWLKKQVKVLTDSNMKHIQIQKSMKVKMDKILKKLKDLEDRYCELVLEEKI